MATVRNMPALWFRLRKMYNSESMHSGALFVQHNTNAVYPIVNESKFRDNPPLHQSSLPDPSCACICVC